MPDISMCKGTKCPLKKTCYRYKVKPDPYWQTYFVDPPYHNETKSCDYHWQYLKTLKNNKKKPKVIKK